MSRTSSFTGEPAKPRLSAHTTGDAPVPAHTTGDAPVPAHTTGDAPVSAHTTGDAPVPVPAQTESALRRAVNAAGSSAPPRQACVGKAGHGAVSPAEQLDALRAPEDRLSTGRRRGTDPAALNSRAAAADPATPTRYVADRPAPGPRRYDLAHPADRR
ncbi:hypothetical protein J2X68_007653 [Streptomyces sp. 3330]|uniref:hypothetical protein n=1 Tax=Streptomyces sp. 3330 TaxID=2817755 RepID=UPI0028543D9A|nr:hypothetical protein [Streptomyces sp. 3330]MDR6980911.1 hypothetical protein [Streptomyces sp. 3330]